MPRIRLLGLLLLSACATHPPLPPAAERCIDPRPELCTMEYVPVCASLAETSAPEATYANACTACADPAVAWHRPGACPP